MTGNHLDLRLDGPTAEITLTRPERRNAVGTAFLHELDHALGAIRSAPSVRAVVITGSGPAFSAGADIAEMSAMPGRDEFRRFLELIQSTFASLERLAIPTIAALNGPAYGGGCELALACDFRLLAEGASLGVPEVKIGALPGAGGSQRLAHALPPAIARRMILLGDPLSADECIRFGLANAVVPADRLLDEARAWAARLAALPPLAVQAGKTLAYLAHNTDLATGMEAERLTVTSLFETADRAEGMRAFLEKRPPSFTGR
ncbi:MAG: enoyl-CoA hydratase/isomerase family protein [Actinobacteria bacterium]|nr:enoyl-CoA hydratase/isomerase family protein [Actinomycetota bacterium]